jgi:DNA modification methylase
MKASTALPLFGETQQTEARLARHDRLTFKANLANGRHGWLRLTPAYSIHLVEELASRLTLRDRVLDPFCGTGTTALVCAQKGIACHTVDINPFLVWLANAKCSSYSQQVLVRARDKLSHCLSSLSQPSEDAWTPKIKDIHKWWEPGVLRMLATVFQRIEVKDSDVPARDLLRVIFCKVAIEFASVSFGHQSMSFRKTTPEDLLFEEPAEERIRHAFQRIGHEIFLSANEPLQEEKAKAFRGDSRSLNEILPRKDYTAVITSPPYPNRMSYIRELRPYMYWLGYLKSGREAGELDWQAIGGTWGCATSNLMKWQAAGAENGLGSMLDSVLRGISVQSEILSRYVRKYFQDTASHIAGLKRVLAPGATVHYVVGNSKFYDVMLHTERLYAELFEANGFKDASIQTIRKRTSKKELFEYIVSAKLG